MNTNCEQDNVRGCACQKNNTTMCSNGPGMNQAIVMPTQVVTRQAFNFVEQPIIYPIEYRTIQRTVLVPRCYQTFTHTCC